MNTLSLPLRGRRRPALTAFNPALPVDDSLVVAGELRDQFNGLKDLIDAIQTINAAQIDSVTTGNPGDPAVVTLTVDAGTLKFSFVLPRGTEGPTGEPGQNGAPGAGVSGAVVDSTTTLNPGDPASASASFDGSLVHFSFGIPPGPQGPPGEVTNSQLSSAIAGTSSNSNAVAALSFGAGPDYDAAQQQDIIAKINELISALRR